MKRYLFDTSVILAAILAGHKHFNQAFDWIKAVSKGKIQGFVSHHCLAEVYSNLSGLYQNPVIPTKTCQSLIFDSLLKNFTAIDLSTKDYKLAIIRSVDKNLRNGIIYDAIHLQAALKKDCQAVLTFNVKDFKNLIKEDDHIKIISP